MPTHLNLPDQVLTLWSFSLTARQLLLLLVGGGIGGSVWQHLAVLGHYAVPGQGLRLLLSLLPFLLVLLIAWYQHGGRYLEVWLVVLVRYRLRPKRYFWRSIRACEHISIHSFPVVTILIWKRRPARIFGILQLGRRRNEAGTRTARRPA